MTPTLILALAAGTPAAPPPDRVARDVASGFPATSSLGSAVGLLFVTCRMFPLNAATAVWTPPE
jgi:hypothetical protein